MSDIMSDKSVFREDEWRNKRHFLNPSKYKEYELHVSGLGFLNKINFIKDHYEKFTPMDLLSQEDFVSFHKKTKVYIIRKEISSKEERLLQENNFKLVKKWGTLLIDTAKEFNIDKGNTSIVRKGERTLVFEEVSDLEDFKKYYLLFKQVRRQEGLRTAAFGEYLKVFNINYYKVFVAKQEGRIVAGIGTIANDNYMLQLNIARDKSCSAGADFLTYKLLQYCKEKGIRWFDFAGIDPNPKEGSKDYFIKKYKEKWSGEYYNEYIYERR